MALALLGNNMMTSRSQKKSLKNLATDYEFVGYYSYTKSNNDITLSYGIFYSFIHQPRQLIYLVKKLENIGINQWLTRSDVNDNTTVVSPQLENVSQLVLHNQFEKVSMTIDKTPIYVCHKKYFLSNQVNYRKGMSNIFAIESQYLNSTDDNLITTTPRTSIGDNDFPLNSYHYSLFESEVSNLPYSTLIRQLSNRQSNSFIDTEFRSIRFRILLAALFHQEIPIAITKNKKTLSFHIDNVMEEQFCVILSCPGVLSHIQRLPHLARSVSTLTHTNDELFPHLIPKDGFKIHLPCVSILHELLGDNYSFFPIKNARHFHGKTNTISYAFIPPIQSNLCFTYDINQGRLTVTSKLSTGSFQDATCSHQRLVTEIKEWNSLLRGLFVLYYIILYY